MGGLLVYQNPPFSVKQKLFHRHFYFEEQLHKALFNKAIFTFCSPKSNSCEHSRADC